MDNFKINTSQNVNLETQRAGIGDRLIAFTIDYLILSGLLILTSFAIDWSNINNLTIIYVFMAILLFFYHFLSEIFLNGQSIGKIFRKLRVVNLKAERASVFQYFIRALLRPIDSVSGVGILVVIVSKKSQRLGDLAAGTMVIRLNPTVTYSDTVFTNIEEDYKPVFDRMPVIRLADKDIELIKLITAKARKDLEFETIGITFEKVISITGIDTKMIPIDFLETIVKDYNFYNA